MNDFGSAAYYKRMWLLARERASFAEEWAEEWAEGWENRTELMGAKVDDLQRIAESRKAQVTEYGKVVERQRAEIERLQAEVTRLETLHDCDPSEQHQRCLTYVVD